MLQEIVIKEQKLIQQLANSITYKKNVRITTCSKKKKIPRREQKALYKETSEDLQFCNYSIKYELETKKLS